MAERQDGVEETPGTGQSEGGAYPNPYDDKTKKTGGFMGHGGQADIDYSGTGADKDVGNANAVTEDE